MTACLSDHTLWSLSEGDGTAAERAHLASCTLCAWRAKHLASDLGLIVRVLADEPPPAARPRSWAPVRTLALAAALFLAIGLSLFARSRPPVVVASSRDGVAALDRFSATVFDDDDAATDDTDAMAVALAAAAPCEWQDAGCRDLGQPLF